VFEWLAQEMVGLDASRKRVEQAYADDAVDRA